MSLEDNDQILKLKKTLDECDYNPSKKECIINDIMSVLNYKKKKNEAKFFLKTKNQDKIIMVYFPMSVELVYKNYNTPINIFFPKNYPYEPPQIFYRTS
jgi:ubiquitin-protein ligase